MIFAKIKKIRSVFLAIVVLFVSMQTLFADSTVNTMGGDFTLTDHNGETFKLSKHRGKVVLMFFGYTHCPDICPTELGTLSKILKQLGDNSDNIISLFITVDPERDTVEKLKNYVKFFSPNLIGLTGTTEEILEVTKRFKVQRKVHKAKEGSNYYLVDHSANLFVINAQGQLSQLIPFGLPTEHILQVVKQEIGALNQTTN